MYNPAGANVRYLQWRPQGTHISGESAVYIGSGTCAWLLPLSALSLSAQLLGQDRPFATDTKRQYGETVRT